MVLYMQSGVGLGWVGIAQNETTEAARKQEAELIERVGQPSHDGPLLGPCQKRA